MKLTMQRKKLRLPSRVMMVSETERTVLQNLVRKGGTGNVIEFLDPAAYNFDQAFDLANQLQNKDFLKLLYSNFNKNLVVVELTLPGFEAGK